MNRSLTFLALVCGLWAASPAPASTIAEIAAMPEGGRATADLGLAGQPVPTGLLDITGIVIPNPAGDGYRLAPRSPGDIVSVPEPGRPGILGLTLAMALAWRKRAGQAARTASTQYGERPIFFRSPDPSLAPHAHQP
ncbi:MAG: hypothetical protein NTW21_38145 [Verrucomicrobia bacterium]|nr:hypothetical protein [Verrucomicrobiota bacterium]